MEEENSEESIQNLQPLSPETQQSVKLEAFDENLLTVDDKRILDTVREMARVGSNPVTTTPLPTADGWKQFWANTAKIPAYFVSNLSGKYASATSVDEVQWSDFDGYALLPSTVLDAASAAQLSPVTIQLGHYAAERQKYFSQNVAPKYNQLLEVIWPRIKNDHPQDYKQFLRENFADPEIAEFFNQIQGREDSKEITDLIRTGPLKLLQIAVESRSEFEEKMKDPQMRNQGQSISDAFSEEFEGAENYLTDFRQTLETVARDFSDTSMTYLAPLLPVIQSSGVGKSRLAIEYCRKYPSAYICLREPDSTGYPVRSDFAGLLLPSRQQLSRILGDLPQSTLFVTYYLLFFAAYLQLATEFIQSLPEKKCIEHFSAQWIERQDWTNGGKDIQKRLKIVLAHYLIVCTKGVAYESMKKYARESRPYFWAARMLRTSVQKLDEAWNVQVITERQQFGFFTFFVDECRPMLKAINDIYSDISPFIYFRVAAHFFPKGQNIKLALVVLDTFGSVTDYSPDEIPDTSLRFIIHKKLFSPYSRFHYQNTNDEALKHPADTESVKYNLSSVGRYLWRASDADGTIETAKYKLLLSYDKEKSKFTDERVLAILGSRLALQFHAHETLALRLVHAHGAYLFHVSDDRKTVTMGYPPEPALAEAAAQLQTAEGSNFSWSKILPKLLQFVSAGVVEAGIRGELVARIILLMTMDVARCALKTPLMSSPIQVNEFFGYLFGDERVVKMKAAFGNAAHADQLFKGHINFTHFVYAAGVLKSTSFVSFYRRFAAVLCRRNQETIDLLLPVSLDNNRYSAILVQVKNYEKGTGFPIVPKNIISCVEMEGDALDSEFSVGAFTTGEEQTSNEAHTETNSASTLAEENLPYLYLFFQHGPYQDRKSGVWSILEQGANNRLKFANKGGQSSSQTSDATQKAACKDTNSRTLAIRAAEHGPTDTAENGSQQNSTDSSAENGSNAQVISTSPYIMVGALNISREVYPLFDWKRFFHEPSSPTSPQSPIAPEPSSPPTISQPSVNWMTKNDSETIVFLLRHLRQAWAEPLSSLIVARQSRCTTLSDHAFKMTHQSYLSVLRLTYMGVSGNDKNTKKRTKAIAVTPQPPAKRTRTNHNQVISSNSSSSRTQPHDNK